MGRRRVAGVTAGVLSVGATVAAVTVFSLPKDDDGSAGRAPRGGAGPRGCRD